MITTKEPTTAKQNIFGACIKKQQLLIDDFKSRIKSLLETSGLGNEEGYDNNDVAQSTERANEINAMNEQLEFANKEMTELTRLDKFQKVCTTVEPGAVVITNMNNYFISTSIEEFFVHGKQYIGVSASSPFYQQMRGKKKGDTFSRKGIRYEIIDIF